MRLRVQIAGTTSLVPLPKSEESVANDRCGASFDLDFSKQGTIGKASGA